MAVRWKRLLSQTSMIFLPRYCFTSTIRNTRKAALVVAVLATNEIWHFVPDQYVSIAVYLAGALGLYDLREAVERLEQKIDQIPPKS